MPRRPTGSLFRNAAGRLYVRVLVGDNDRESFPLDPKLTEQQAEQRKELVADLAARLRASRNVTRDAIVALLERAAVGEGRALRDVIAATPAPGRSPPACRRHCAPGSRSAATRRHPRRSSSTRTAIASASSTRPSGSAPTSSSPASTARSSSRIPRSVSSTFITIAR
ncbi:hypothetical protein AB3662_33780 [Sorangium cellulosum]|uniref:hypothetical protein n=1 Tax=Sorangium cellulosum TaxID=56 RepID=UPI003D9A8828